jgi:hypothetical protein
MKKQLLTLFLFIVFTINGYSQDILVNRFYNSGTSDGTDDMIELIVVKDNLDIRNWIIKDYANGTISLEDAGGRFRFENIDLWKDLKSGTVIVLTKMPTADIATYTPILGANNIISVGINDARYLRDISDSKVFNLTLHEAVLIRKDDGTGSHLGQDNAVHALGYGDFFNRTTWGSISSPKSLFNIGVWSDQSKSNGTLGAVELKLSDIESFVTPFDKSIPLENLPNEWVRKTELMQDWPYGAEVYQMTTDYSYGGVTRKMNAYCVILNPKIIDLKMAYSIAPQKTPQRFVSDESGKVLACLNGTFFSTSSALGLVKYGAQTHYQALLSLTRNAKSYPVTRAAFGLSPDFKPSVAWIYPYQYTPYTNGGTAFTTPYAYSSPLMQDVNNDPLPAPTKESGTLWHVNTAIGGAPMLVKNGAINMTADYELANLDNTSLRARSAIGYTPNGNVVLMAAEGGNTATEVGGLTLLDLANLMKDLGCEGAINLDGGGSTSLRINNQPTVRPSDSGNERVMPSVLMLKTKK